MTRADLRSHGRVRFGVLSKGTMSRRAWLDLARRCEGQGYDTLLVPDHVDPQFSTGAALASAASATTVLRFGTLVTNLDLWLPELVAKEAATLAVLTGDRFELGIGAGWKPRDYDAVGRKLDPGPRRFARFVGSFDRLCAALDRELDAHSPDSRPQRPRLLIGAGGPRMLEFAAARADVVGLTRRARLIPLPDASARDISRPVVEEKIALLRRAASARGGIAELNVMLTGVAIGPRSAEAVRERARSGGVDETTIRESPELLYAESAEEAADRIRERVEELGIGYFAVPDAAAESFAAVVQRFR